MYGFVSNPGSPAKNRLGFSTASEGASLLSAEASKRVVNHTRRRTPPGCARSTARRTRLIAGGWGDSVIVNDQEVLLEHLHLISEREPRITERVYERLFQRHPQLRKLFGSHAEVVQQDMLNETLLAVVDSLEGMAGLESSMELLAATHLEFEVRDEMYDWWAESILEVLSEVSGPDWSPRLERLWRERMNFLCSRMRPGEQPGARQAS